MAVAKDLHDHPLLKAFQKDEQGKLDIQRQAKCKALESEKVEHHRNREALQRKAEQAEAEFERLKKLLEAAQKNHLEALKNLSLENSRFSGLERKLQGFVINNAPVEIDQFISKWMDCSDEERKWVRVEEQQGHPHPLTGMVTSIFKSNKKPLDKRLSGIRKAIEQARALKQDPFCDVAAALKAIEADIPEFKRPI